MATVSRFTALIRSYYYFFDRFEEGIPNQISFSCTGSCCGYVPLETSFLPRAQILEEINSRTGYQLKFNNFSENSSLVQLITQRPDGKQQAVAETQETVNEGHA